MKKVNLYEAKNNLSKLVDLAARGQEIIICKSGKPMAKLVSLKSSKKSIDLFGAWAGKMWIADDFDILPEDFMNHFK